VSNQAGRRPRRQHVGTDPPSSLDSQGNDATSISWAIRSPTGPWLGQYYGCPILAPEPTRTTAAPSCAAAVDRSRRSSSKPTGRRSGRQRQHSELTGEGRSFVAAWPMRRSSTGRAWRPSMRRGSCAPPGPATPSGRAQVSHNLGVEQGQWIVKSFYLGESLFGTPESHINMDVVAVS